MYDLIIIGSGPAGLGSGHLCGAGSPEYARNREGGYERWTDPPDRGGG